MKKNLLEHHEEIGLKFKALANSAQLEILRLLKERECLCGELVDELPLAQATVSQHLKVLKEAGFVISRDTGACVAYTLNPDAFEELKEAFFTL
ncbi:MAG: ArsR/SmtB family transcription factor [Chlorobiales bacterium]